MHMCVYWLELHNYTFLTQFFSYNEVSTDLANKAAWKQCFQVNEVKLPTGYYIGISATTGDLSDNHDILSIRLFELDLSDDDVSTNLFFFYTSIILNIYYVCKTSVSLVTKDVNYLITVIKKLAIINNMSIYSLRIKKTDHKLCHQQHFTMHQEVCI